ncbi:MAG: glucokinase [Burkholderiales bacterium]|nr:glucokinase [Burkholderiales bacterium]
MLIAGDVGGTKTLLALYDPARGPRRPLAEDEFPSARYAGLEVMVGEFLAKHDARATAACFDVAGPVIGGRAKLTNLPWVLEEHALARALGIPSAMLLNDLQAIAQAVPHLDATELRTVKPGEAQPRGAKAVLAPGTGLGEAFLVWNGEDYLACASEGGHADFAPADELQSGLLAYLRARYGHVGFERVCSGMGLPNIYDFLRDAGHARESPQLAARLANAADRTPLIVQTALGEPPDPLCALTLQTFVCVLGAEAGNLALKVLATGGVYLGGGIPPRILGQLEDGRLAQAFVAKGRFEATLRPIPIHVIPAQAALLGAAIYGLRRLRES